MRDGDGEEPLDGGERRRRRRVVEVRARPSSLRRAETREELVADGSDEARAYDVAAFVPGRGHREARVDEPEAVDDEREFRRAVHALLRQRGEELRARAAEVVVVARE